MIYNVVFSPPDHCEVQTNSNKTANKIDRSMDGYYCPIYRSLKQTMAFKTKKSTAQKRAADSAASQARNLALPKRQRAEANAVAKAERAHRAEASMEMADVVPETPSRAESNAGTGVDRRVAARRARTTMAEQEEAGYQICSHESLR